MVVPIPGGSLDPLTVPKYVTPLVIPPQMTPTSGGQGYAVDHYEIAVRQFQQQVLPTGMPVTTVWSYGSVTYSDTLNYPAFTIEASYQVPVRVRWINDLVDNRGDFLPHLLPVDPTLHWANPSGGATGRDMRPTFPSTPGQYTGPVPIVTHLHGGHTEDHSDGYTEAWFLPAARNIPTASRPKVPGMTTSAGSLPSAGSGAQVRRYSNTPMISALLQCGTTTIPWV